MYGSKVHRPHVQDGMKRLFDPRKHHLSVWTWISDPYVPRPSSFSPPSVAPETAGSTPLHYAASIGLHDVAAFLIDEHLQDVNARDYNRGETPLHVASREGHAVVAQLLLENGADVEALGEHQRTPLHLASMYGRVEVAQVLLKHGAEVDKTDFRKVGSHPISNNGAPFHCSMSGIPSREVSITFIKFTPLGLALDGGRGDVARVLLEHGANRSICREVVRTKEIERNAFYRGSKRQVGFSRSYSPIALYIILVCIYLFVPHFYPKLIVSRIQRWPIINTMYIIIVSLYHLLF